MAEKDPPCGEHDVRLTRVEKDTEKQWEAINQLEKRPPVWCTAAISLLTFLLGASLTYAALMMRLIGK